MSGAPLSHLLPPLPGFTALSRTYAPWPVWSGSVAKPVQFAAMPKKAAVRLWHRARDFDRGTHEPGRHGGALGPTALAVLHALIFDFLNHRTGRLDPSYAAIAGKAGVCTRTVASALQRLKALGIRQRPCRARGAIPRPCPLRSPRRPWRAIWRARCMCWPVIRRTGWQPPWRGSGGRSWPATREIYRSARDAEKPAPELDPTCNSRFGPADRRKEGALNKKRRAELCSPPAIRLCGRKPITHPTRWTALSKLPVLERLYRHT